MLKNGVRQKDLAEKLQIDHSRANRIMSFRKSVNLDDMARAIEAAGGYLEFSVKED